MDHDRGALTSSEEIAAAYLEWLDATSADPTRDAILVTALQAETDCLHVLHELRALTGRVRALPVH